MPVAGLFWLVTNCQLLGRYGRLLEHKVSSAMAFWLVASTSRLINGCYGTLFSCQDIIRQLLGCSGWLIEQQVPVGIEFWLVSRKTREFLGYRVPVARVFGVVTRAYCFLSQVNKAQSL